MSDVGLMGSRQVKAFLAATLPRVCRATTRLAWLALVLCGPARAQALEAEPPPGPLYRYQTNPANNPKAIVSAMLARDLQNLGRYTGWNEVEYTPLFESFPPYIVTRTKGDDGKLHEREDVPAFGRCAQQMIVKSAKVTKVEQAPDPLSPVNAPRGLKNEVLVTVQAEVLALQLDRQDAIPENERCSWLGLRVKNTQTGKSEAYFDHMDNDRALLQMMKQFGTVQGNYVIVDPKGAQIGSTVAQNLPGEAAPVENYAPRTVQVHNPDDNTLNVAIHFQAALLNALRHPPLAANRGTDLALSMQDMQRIASEDMQRIASDAGLSDYGWFKPGALQAQADQAAQQLTQAAVEGLATTTAQASATVAAALGEVKALSEVTALAQPATVNLSTDATGHASVDLYLGPNRVASVPSPVQEKELIQINAGLSMAQTLDGLQHWDQMGDVARFTSLVGLATYFKSFAVDARMAVNASCFLACA